MDATILNGIRMFAHMELIGMFVAFGIFTVAARGVILTIDICHWHLFATGMALLALWTIGLMVSIGTTPLISRSSIVPVLAFLELSGTTLTWAGMILTFRRSFKVSLFLRRDINRRIL